MAIQIPLAVAPILRSALEAQGAQPDVIATDGTLDLARLLAVGYETISFKSRITPPISINVASLSGPPSALALIAQPAVVFEGKAGRIEIAPYGVPSGFVGSVVSLLIFSAVFGAGYAIGRRRS